MNKLILSLAIVSIFLSSGAVLNTVNKAELIKPVSNDVIKVSESEFDSALIDFNRQIDALNNTLNSNDSSDGDKLIQQLSLISAHIKEITVELSTQRESIQYLEALITANPNNQMFTAQTAPPTSQAVEAQLSQVYSSYDQKISNDVPDISGEAALADYFQSAIQNVEEFPGLTGASIQESTCVTDICRMKIEYNAQDGNSTPAQFEESFLFAMSQMGKEASGTLHSEDDDSGGTVLTLYMLNKDEGTPN